MWKHVYQHEIDSETLCGYHLAKLSSVVIKMDKFSFNFNKDTGITPLLSKMKWLEIPTHVQLHNKRCSIPSVALHFYNPAPTVILYIMKCQTI